MKRLGLALIVLFAIILSAAGPTGAPDVTSVAALKAIPTTQFKYIYREGFRTPYDGGQAGYISSPDACSLNSGSGDDGAEVKPNVGTGCWLLPKLDGYDVRIWGCLVNGIANDSACQNAANTAISTLLGGGRMFIPATGNCMLGQNFAAGTASGAGVVLEGPSVYACLKLQDNATQPLFQTSNAYLYMHRQVTGTVTEATTSMPVGETPPLDIGPTQTIFIIDNTGTSRRAITANPAISGSNVLISSWLDGAFTAPAGSWWGDLNHVGAANSGLKNLYLYGNASPVTVAQPTPKQPFTNSLVGALQTVSAGSNLTLVGGTPTVPTPYANIPVEFGSANDLSGVTFTVSCTIIRQDFISAAITTAVAGPNKNKVTTPEGCHQVTQIAVSVATATGVTVGWADGATAGDAVVVYAPMFRLENVLVQDARGWCFRTGFVPGTGFTSAAPASTTWETQENYFTNAQCLSADTGGYWYGGPNDSRLNSLTVGFTKWMGLWFDRWCGGCNAEHVHISGGNTGKEPGVRESWIGIQVSADTVTCIECKAEESWINVLLMANSPRFVETQVFHFNTPASNRVGFQIGHTTYNVGRLVTGYRLIGEGKKLGAGAVKFVLDGGAGKIEMNVFNDGAYAGSLPFNGTPLACASGGSYIRLLDGVAPINSLIRDGPCPAFTPSMRFGGVAVAQTSVGHWQGNRLEATITLTATPGTGAITIVSLPANFQPIGTCPVTVAFSNNLVGLAGTLGGYVQGGTLTVNQNTSAGTAPLTEDATPSPFVNGTNFFFTVGPCIQ